VARGLVDAISLKKHVFLLLFLQLRRSGNGSKNHAPIAPTMLPKWWTIKPLRRLFLILGASLTHPLLDASCIAKKSIKNPENPSGPGWGRPAWPPRRSRWLPKKQQIKRRRMKPRNYENLSAKAAALQIAAKSPWPFLSQRRLRSRSRISEPMNLTKSALRWKQRKKTARRTCAIFFWLKIGSVSEGRTVALDSHCDALAENFDAARKGALPLLQSLQPRACSAIASEFQSSVCDSDSTARAKRF